MTTRITVVYFNRDTDQTGNTSSTASGPAEYQNRKQLLKDIESTINQAGDNCVVTDLILTTNPKVYPLTN